MHFSSPYKYYVGQKHCNCRREPPWPQPTFPYISGLWRLHRKYHLLSQETEREDAEYQGEVQLSLPQKVTWGGFYHLKRIVSDSDQWCYPVKWGVWLKRALWHRKGQHWPEGCGKTSAGHICPHPWTPKSLEDEEESLIGSWVTRDLTNVPIGGHFLELCGNRVRNRKETVRWICS